MSGSPLSLKPFLSAKPPREFCQGRAPVYISPSFYCHYALYHVYHVLASLANCIVFSPMPETPGTASTTCAVWLFSPEFFYAHHWSYSEK